jgi:F0F1-type ATP synthase delta subunit
MKISPIKYAEALAVALEENDNHAEVVQGFLKMLARKKHMKLLGKILKAFEKEWAKRNGIVKFQLEYPAKFEKMPEEFAEAVRNKFKHSPSGTGERKALPAVALEMTSKPSKTMIGGLRVLIGDTLIDASVESRLKNLLTSLTF